MKKNKRFFLEKTIILLYSIKYKFLELFTEYKLMKIIFNFYLKKKKIKIKLGFDLRGKFLHLGHFVLLNKFNFLKLFTLDMIIILGNVTSIIGDSFSKFTKRNLLKNIFIKNNIKEFLNQLKIIIKFKKVKIYYNYDWICFLKLSELIKLFSKIKVNYLLERKKIKRSIKKDNVFFVELFYPFIQSYDSFFIKSDIEFGGIDQKINFKFTNKILKKLNVKKQVNLLNSLLLGLNGLNKMSKSASNFISFYFKFKKFYKKFFKIPFYLLKIYYNLLYLKNIEKNFFIKKNYEIFFLKKKLINYLIKNIYNKKFLYIFYKKELIFYKKFFLFKKNFIILYKIYKIFFFKKSKNDFKFSIKKNLIKVNKIIIKNYNIFLIKGFYYINLENNKFYIIIY